MPDINPTVGDEIQVEISVSGTESPQFLSAKIMTKNPDGKWEIELAAIPPMRGKVDLLRYKWDHTRKLWKRKPNEPTSKVGHILALESQKGL